MEPDKLSLDIIDRYLEQELLMASLYGSYAKFYTEHKNFWASLVDEELEHASWIKHFQNSLPLDKISFLEGKTRISALDSSIVYLKGIINEFDKNPLGQLKAVSICLDLERSLIERNVFKHFESDSSEVKKILGVLRDAQEEHVKKIEQFMAEVRKEQTGRVF